MKTRAFICSILALSLFSGILSGQPFNKVKLDSLFTYLAENNKAMGGLAISKNGSIVYARAIGFSSITPQKKIASTEKTRYRVGSISKVFTATLVFQIIEEGKLDLSTTLDKYFPTIPNASSIKISYLLNHRSGIHSYTDDLNYLQWGYQPKTHDEMIRILSAGKPDFEPGTASAYSHSNYLLLGYILEKICKKSYNEILNERICSKIGLMDTYYGDKTDISKNESYSYKYTTSWEQLPQTNMSIPHGSGGIVSTPSDLVRFMDALFTGQLINKGSLDQMKTITDNYGMGLFYLPFKGKVSYGHTGSIDGFAATAGYFPNDNISVAYISNGTVYPMLEILFGSLDIYFNLPYDFPVFTTYFVNPKDLDLYIGVYSCSQIPFKITLTKNRSTLYGQVPGQQAVPLEAVAENIFKLEIASAVIRFNPLKNEFNLEQGGRKYTFTKE
jgi:D-alanyl-D-alanine carboxypeptidase